MRILIVTGLSGAGKSNALRALEDMNYFCVDNLPIPLLGKFVDLLDGNLEVDKVALVMDVREGEFLSGYQQVVFAIRKQGHIVEVLFLDASDAQLIRRFSETRRRHPLSPDDLTSGISSERALLKPLREDASAAIIDTSELTVHQLKGIIRERYGKSNGTLTLTVLSFGFKHGVPTEADLAFDVRFLPNPYFIEELSALSGLDDAVAAFVFDSAEASEYLNHIEGILAFSLPKYQREGKAHLTIAIGCTGGRHRSVALAEKLGTNLAGKWPITLRHRDLSLPGGSNQ